MEKKMRSAIAGGTLLILLGVFFLVVQVVPELIGRISWPFIVIGVGAAFLLLSIVTWTPGLAVPGCIVGGIGGILYWQNFTGQWETWSFVWALIPGFVGVGVLISELMEGRPGKAITEGGWPILVSLVLFFLFGSFFGQIPFFGSSWAVLLIVIGVLIVVKPLVKIGGKKDKGGE